MKATSVSSGEINIFTTVSITYYCIKETSPAIMQLVILTARKVEEHYGPTPKK